MTHTPTDTDRTSPDHVTPEEFRLLSEAAAWVHEILSPATMGVACGGRPDRATLVVALAGVMEYEALTWRDPDRDGVWLIHDDGGPLGNAMHDAAPPATPYPDVALVVIRRLSLPAARREVRAACERAQAHALRWAMRRLLRAQGAEVQP